VSFAVKVVPGASRDAVAGAYGDAVKVRVAAPPEAGAANAAVVRLLAATLGVPVGDVWIVRGHTTPRKRVVVVGVTADELRGKLGA
jgi:uncharacterized protein (TIGR00251 family)